MNTGWLLTNIVSALLLPPLVFIVPAIAGLVLARRWPRFGAMLCMLCLLVLVVFSTVAGARLLVAPLENRSSPVAAAPANDAQAIVVLGGGRLANAPEYGGRDMPGPITLARLRYAAHLHRITGLPLLVTGGAPDGAAESEAVLMERVLREDFGVPVRWLEQQSANTAQNAQMSAVLLQKLGIRRIFLVTDAMHMPRAHMMFAHHGFAVTAAPTMFFSHEPAGPQHFIPGGQGMRLSHYAMHEWIGLLWYRWRHDASVPGSPHPVEAGR